MKKLRAVFYARVSTEEEKQVNALEKQVQENIDTIKEKGWELVDRYVDEGKSGTKVKGRDEYQRLLDDMDTAKFDIIVIKSQDRLHRNTRDWYIFADKLNTSGKRLYLYIEQKFYKPAEDALITGIKAILAEEFSRDLSKKVNNANKKRIERAVNGGDLSIFSNGLCYGWDFIDGQYVINEAEAKIKKYIADLYLQGNGLRNIQRILTAEGHRNRNGREFSPVTIRNMLMDTKNYGTITSNKTHKDFDSKKTVKNPKSEWIYIDNVVPPIYDKETYDKICEMLEQRIDQSGIRGRKVGSHPLSGKIFCSECGKPYWKIVRHPTVKNPHYTGTAWRCSSYAQHGRKIPTKRTKGGYPIDRTNGCQGMDVQDVYIMRVLKDIGDTLEVNKDVVKKDMLQWLNNLLKQLNSSANTQSMETELKRQEGRKNKLTEAYMDGILSKEDYSIKYKEVEDTISRLTAEIATAENNKDVQEIKEVIANIDTEIDKYINSTEFDSSRVDFLIDHIERITVSGTHFIIELDLLAGAILAGENFFQYVQGSRHNIIQTEKPYTIPIYKGELKVVLMIA